MYALVVQQLLWEALGDLFYFPLWWYTLGAFRVGTWCFSLLQIGNSELEPGLWLRNIFVPMYGQHDIEGRLISFVMRVVQIILRTFALAVWLAFCLLLFFGWLLLPAAVVAAFIVSIAAH